VHGRSQLVRAAQAVLAQRRATASGPRVLWAGISEDPGAFARRVKREADKPGLLLAVVAHDYRVNLPASVKRVELPVKCFRVLHPANVARFKVLKGGRGAAKSWSIARALIIFALEQPLSILCCREIQNSIRASVHKLLSQQIRALELQRWFTIDIRAITAYNGSTFDFEGLYANVDKIKSYEGADICWIEEGASISADSWEILEPTLRKPGSYFVCNYNPDGADDPTHVMFAIRPRPDASVEHVTFSDNPYLTDPLRKAMEYMRSVDDDAYRHVWLGECRAHSDAQILRGKFVVEEFEPKPEWAGPYLGLDFGFSTDPTAAVQAYVHERTLYVSHEAWAVGCDIDRTPALLDQIPGARTQVMRADNARPETISYLQRNGYPRVVAVEKWAGSVEDGVAHLRQYEKIVIHPRCERTLEEARLYAYKTDRLTGTVLADIVDKFNHCMDALRYALAPLIRRKTTGLLDYLRAEAAKPRDKQSAPGVTITPLTGVWH